MPVEKIADELRKRKIATPRGGDWHRRTWRIDRSNPALLTQFDCKKAADRGMIGCDERQGINCSGFHRYLLYALVAGPKW
jgi:hypothetical protein